MSYNYFDPSTANELAKFQGSFAGIQASNTTTCGVAMAPTSIYNQAGYYALQDTSTGYVQLQKMHDDSLYTKQWYDQGTGTIFDFSQGGTGITVNPNHSSQQNNNTTNNTTNNNTNSGQVNSNGTIQYPWGPGVVVVQPNNGVTNQTITNSNGTTTQVKVDENGDPIMLDADDIFELVDAGVYDNTTEALAATQKEGYTVADEEQAKLGIYTDESEDRIALVMDKYGIDRAEALEMLGDKAVPQIAEDIDLHAKFGNLLDKGFSKKEAKKFLEEMGYEVPDEYMKDTPKYKDKDQARIDALVESTGCTPEEAAKMLGAKPKEDGWLKKAWDGTCNFFSGIGEGISNAWDSFCDWIW